VGSLFERLNAGCPPLAAEGTIEHEKSQSIERLLRWLVNNWRGNTITLRQICLYGPYPLRAEQKAALGLTLGLVERGWLIPLKPRRHDSRAWEIGPKRHHPQAQQNVAGG
jgi:hypothetical protein